MNLVPNAIEFARENPVEAGLLGASMALPWPVGDAVGFAGDVMGMVNRPEDRTWGNAALATAGLLPGVIGLGMVRRADDAPGVMASTGDLPANVADFATRKSARDKENLVEKIHGAIRSIPAVQAEKQRANFKYHEGGFLPLPIGTRMIPPKGKGRPTDVYRISGYRADPKNPEIYGYEITSPSGDAGYIPVSDPTLGLRENSATSIGGWKAALGPGGRVEKDYQLPQWQRKDPTMPERSVEERAKIDAEYEALFGDTNPTGDLPMDTAHEIARINAAKPVEEGGLGLPLDNTPEMRSAALGYDTDAYHGTPGTSDDGYYSLQQGEWVRAPGEMAYNSDGSFNSAAFNWIPKKQQKVWFTPDPSYAATYARRLGEDKGAIYPVLLRSNAVNRGVVDSEYYVRDPSAIRSRFAAFDPAKRDSTDLLAGIAAGGLLSPLALDYLYADNEPQ